MRFGMRSLLLIAGATLPLGACEKALPPAPAPAVSTPPPAPPAPPPVRSVNATWSFSSDDACTAIAASSAGALRVSVEREKLTLSVFGAPGTPFPGGSIVPVVYAGPSGSWTLAARPAGPRRIVASEPMTEVQASRILFLLDGGAIRLGRASTDFPTLRIPNAGVAGQAWFDCVRKVLLP